MAPAAQQKTPETPEPRNFTFKPKLGLTVPVDIPTGPQRPNVLADDFFTPSLAAILSAPDGEPVEPCEFFPLAFFQAGSDDFARKNSQKPKVLTLSDAKAKLKDAWKKFGLKNAKASLVEDIIVVRTGKEAKDIFPEGVEPEPGVMCWLRMKKK